MQKKGDKKAIPPPTKGGYENREERGREERERDREKERNREDINTRLKKE